MSDGVDGLNVVTDRVPLSLLDLAVVTTQDTSASALAATTELAVRADELGYARFWVAEHHNMAAVASTSPAVLMAHLAARTNRISVGSGGVMLPNHSPYVIAEQFALLEALHPGRVDLGIGRAPGSDPRTSAAVRAGRDGQAAVESFPNDVIDVLGLLGDQRTDDGLWQHVSATPKATTVPTVVLLGSSNYSARLAGLLGLPFSFAHHFDTGGTERAVDDYRAHFRASERHPRPHLIVSASVVAADTFEQADHLANPSRLRKFGMRTGRRGPLVSPDEAATHPDLDAARAMPNNMIVGTGEQVADGLDRLVALTGADELMLTASAFTLEDRLTTIDRVMTAWQTAAITV